MLRAAYIYWDIQDTSYSQWEAGYSGTGQSNGRMLGRVVLYNYRGNRDRTRKCKDIIIGQHVPCKYTCIMYTGIQDVKYKSVARSNGCWLVVMVSCHGKLSW